MAGLNKQSDREFNKLLKSSVKTAKAMHKDIKKIKKYRHDIENAKQQQERQQAKQQISGEFTIGLTPDGHFYFVDSSGYRITDESTIRKIKSSSQFASVKKDLEQRRQKMLDEAFAESAKETADFVDISKKSPIVHDADYYSYALDNLKKERYSRALFTEEPVSDEEIRDILRKEAQEKVSTLAFWKANKLKEEYVESRFEELKTSLMKAFYEKIDAFEAEQTEIELKENKRFEEEFNTKKHEFEAILSEDGSVVLGQIQAWIRSFSPGYTLDIFPRYDEGSRIAVIVVDLPEIGELPHTEMVRLSSGNLREKQKTQAKLKQEYAQLVFGLAIYISSNVFSLCANVKGILISSFTQKRNKDGEKSNEYIYSIVFNRSAFVDKDFSYVDPISFCLQFPNRSNLSSTSNFKAITPYSLEECIAISNNDPFSN